MNGISGRTNPTHLPSRIVLPPCRSKNASTSCSAVLGEAHPVSVLDREGAAEPAAEQEADRVADHAPRSRRSRSVADVERPLAGKHAAEDHRELAGRDEPDEGGGLGHRQDRDQQVAHWPRLGRGPRSASRSLAAESFSPRSQVTTNSSPRQLESIRRFAALRPRAMSREEADSRRARAAQRTRVAAPVSRSSSSAWPAEGSRSSAAA